MHSAPDADDGCNPADNCPAAPNADQADAGNDPVGDACDPANDHCDDPARPKWIDKIP